jgi:L-amino acid N-acyltransferase YncA
MSRAIRLARREDLASINDIYNYYVTPFDVHISGNA